ncbi:MAG: 2'-5' RNA ligase family protein [Nanoarchaeota archaeon]
MGVYVIALELEEKLSNFIIKQKYSVKRIAGEQIYFNHPPHITVYIISNEDVNEIKNIIEEISKNTKKLSLEIKGLNFFENDNETKANTIFYDFKEEKELRNFQENIILLLSNLDKSEKRYHFIKNKWHPHITIASVEKEKFDKTFKRLKENEIKGRFNIDKVVIYYYIHPEPPIIIKSFKLKNA